MTTAPEHQKLPDIPATDHSTPVAAGVPVNAAISTTEATGIDAAAVTPSGVTRLAEHKGKLAIGVAATLGLMVYYGWREKRLAQTDPEEYARLQRIKAGLRSTADWPQPEKDSVCDAAPGTAPVANPKP
ncbi:MAG: hypothetical protein H7234_04180 [Herminiimonas sp.]|nr:hypothetical protein [Herminiimonas sp.]